MTTKEVKLAEAYGIVKSVAHFMRGSQDEDLAELLGDAVDLLEDVRSEEETE